MSQRVTKSCGVTNAEVAEAAARRMNGRLLADESNVGSLVLELPPHTRRFRFDVAGNCVMIDPTSAMRQTLDRFVDFYAVEASHRFAREHGYEAVEVPLEGGRIQVELYEPERTEVTLGKSAETAGGLC